MKITFIEKIILSVFLFSLLCSIAKSEEKTVDTPPIHERIEWTDIWVTNANKNNLPRVLFVGDSIVRGYFTPTEKALAGKANCARYTTSAFLSHQDFLDGLKVLLKRYSFDVIHINNGLHGWGYTEEQYKAGFPQLITLLNTHAKNATIIWATTTPVRQRGAVNPLEKEKTERVKQRNKIAAQFVKKHHFKTSDLFSLTINHPEYHSRDGVHFNAKGKSAQAKYIAGVVSDALKTRRNKVK